MPSIADTDFEALLRALQGVEFVIVGGFAATVHGSPRLTQDLDIVYRRSPENLHRLAEALKGLAPYPAGAPPGLPFLWDERTLRNGLNFTLSTNVGRLDILGEVAGWRSYDELLAHSSPVTLWGMSARCVDLPELIRLKRAAGRPKDFEVLAELEVLLQKSKDR